MSQANSYFRRSVAHFKSIGISNEIRIAEHIAFLIIIHNEWGQLRESPQDAQQILTKLYEEKKVYFQDRPTPRPPLIDSNVLFNILNLLEYARNASPYGANLGEFFQREIRFELLKTTSGSQYPTPHHIATFMADLAVTDQSEKLLDPTAGSGGLLAAAHVRNAKAKLVGIDFDSEWVSLAFTNLILHGVEQAQIQTKQALDLSTETEYIQQFDGVLMNPPFGGVRNANEVAVTVGSRFGRTTSTVLAAFALQMLKAGGTASFLQPEGILNGSGGEAHLRRVLTSEYQLEAVITLPPDAMQPYSSAASHLFVVRKREPGDVVWFISLTDDGYLAGASRDLTTEPNTQRNELPRARDLVLRTRENAWIPRLAFDIGVIETVTLGEELQGLAVRFIGDVQAVKWDITYRKDGLMVTVRNTAGEINGWLYEGFDAGSFLRFGKEQAASSNWSEQFRRSDWRLESSAWQGISDEVTLTVDVAGKTLALYKNDYIFAAKNTQPEITVSACLLDGDGLPLTPWLKISDEAQQKKLISDKFSRDTNAVNINDSKGNRTGWLIDLTQGEPEKYATLLIVFKPDANLFRSEDGVIYGLLDHGWIEIGMNGALSVKKGVPVKLRRDFTAQGFAIGPAPHHENSNGYSLFGVLVPQSVFFDGEKVGDMRPSRFLPEPEAVPLGHPLDVLATIRRNQTQLSTKVDTLLGILGEPNQYDETAESPADIPAWIEAILGSDQQQLLNILRQQLVDKKPHHFKVGDVVDWCKTQKLQLSEDDLQQQLSLLVRLGIIKEVYMSGQNLYRMIIRGDIQEIPDVLG